MLMTLTCQLSITWTSFSSALKLITLKASTSNKVTFSVTLLPLKLTNAWMKKNAINQLITLLLSQTRLFLSSSLSGHPLKVMSSTPNSLLKSLTLKLARNPLKPMTGPTLLLLPSLVLSPSDLAHSPSITSVSMNALERLLLVKLLSLQLMLRKQLGLLLIWNPLSLLLKRSSLIKRTSRIASNLKRISPSQKEMLFVILTCPTTVCGLAWTLLTVLQ